MFGPGTSATGASPACSRGWTNSGATRVSGPNAAVALLFAGLFFWACGSKSPSAPTPDPPAPTPPTRFSLNGRVTGAGGAGIPTARVEVSAGVNVGKNAIGDNEGRYTLSDLIAGAMTLQVSAAGYTTQSSNVTIGANQTSDFTLTAAPSQPERATLVGRHLVSNRGALSRRGDGGGHVGSRYWTCRQCRRHRTVPAPEPASRRDDRSCVGAGTPVEDGIRHA